MGRRAKQRRTAEPLGIDASTAGFKHHRWGTHRLIAPAETMARVQPFLAQMGITRIANVTGLDRIGVPVVMVCRPNSRSIAVAQGKGVDLAAAKASGVMEAIETHHAERIELPLKLGSHEDLGSSHRLVDVDALAGLASSRYHRSRQLLWIEGRDLLSDAPTWLPYEVVHTNYTLPLPAGSGCFGASTNGLASGNHLLEAITHGICEVVERDAICLWNQQGQERRAPTRIDLATVDDEACRGVLDKLEQADLSVAVWDATTDVGVAAFYCLIMDERHPGAHPGAGAGCHPAREIALLRALTEAVQVRLTYITGARDDLSPDEYTRAGIEQKLRRARLLVRPAPARDFGTVPTHEGATFDDDLHWLLERLRAVGIEQVVAVDLTRPEFGLPVARVVIPGLEGPDDHDDYRPGARARALREARP